MVVSPRFSKKPGKRKKKRSEKSVESKSGDKQVFGDISQLPEQHSTDSIKFVVSNMLAGRCRPLCVSD